MSMSVTTLPSGEVETVGSACVAPFLYVHPVVVRDELGWTVWFEFTDTREPLDRPRTHGISAGHNRENAVRLATATLAGVIFTNGAEVLRDVNGASYVEARADVMGKYLNADLRRLGF